MQSHSSPKLGATPTTPRQEVASTPKSRELCDATQAAYANDLKLFIAAGGTVPCSCDAIKQYLAAQRTKVAPRTLYRRLVAVRHAHEAQRLQSPTDGIGDLLIALSRGCVLTPAMLAGTPMAIAPRIRAVRGATPISRSLLAKMLEPLPSSMKDRRDRALLLMMFMGGLRRAETVATDLADVRITADALVVQMDTRRIAVAATGGDLCAASAVRELIDRSGWDLEAASGPLFRRAERGGALTEDRLDAAAINLIIKRLVKAAGVDPARYSAQSLRAGRLAEMARGAR